MNAWLAPALQRIGAGGSVVLVTVVRVQGSTPREAGARMLVSDETQWDTIGGGHLEWKALARARSLLHSQSDKSACCIEHYALGPSLGQCCGGAATLLLEVLTRQDLAWLTGIDAALRAGRQVIRQRDVPEAHAAMLQSPVSLLHGDQAAGSALSDAQPVAEAGREGSRHRGQQRNCLLSGHAGKMRLVDVLAPPSMHIVLFGAGHVGQAIVHMLAALPCQVSWVDERDAQLPACVPANVTIEATDTPEAVVAQAPAGSFFLVMTHCHALDQRLCREIFRRDDFAYFGLIGSRSKRRKFERRLQERGVDPARLEEMICPIGVQGIHGKAPQVIAVAVVAQLLQVQEMRGAASAAPRPVTVPALRLSAFADELVYAH